MGKLGYLSGEALKSLPRVMDVAGSTPDAAPVIVLLRWFFVFAFRHCRDIQRAGAKFTSVSGSPRGARHASS